MSNTSPNSVSAKNVESFVADIFAATGMSQNTAKRVAIALVEADLSGRASHGVLQADGYLARLIVGSMTTRAAPEIVSENGGAVVLDADDMEGHLAAEGAVEIGIKKAKEFGISTVAVRNNNHIGVVGRYVGMAAEAGCVGIGFCNSKAVMASPGGAEALLGTNPIAIGIPVKGEAPIVIDMATTAGTVGKIRQALTTGDKIPDDWATDKDGKPTTDPQIAIDGVLLPMSGHKGFGLAFAIDLLVGLLSSGGWGSHVNGMRDDLSIGNNSSSLFIVIDIAHFRSLEGFMDEAKRAVERIRNSRKAPGTEQLFTPGERSAKLLEQSAGQMKLAPATAKALAARAVELGESVPEFVQDIADGA